MIFYGEQLAADTTLPQPFTDYIDDPLQARKFIVMKVLTNKT
jgi:hypothetical protein